MGISPLHRLGQLVDDMIGRGLVGITHPEIDDVLTLGPCRLLEVTNNVKDVWWQTLYALKMMIQNRPPGW